MQFLAPWFLLGGLAVAVPLALHLIRHQQRDRIPFSSLMFLKAAPPPVQRKRRLENWPLLLLRCLILLLLALAFARPYLPDPKPAPAGTGAGSRVLFLIDTSASMRRGDLMEQARTRVREALQKQSSADVSALAVFDGDLRVLQPWTQDKAALQSALAGVQATHSATRLGDALIRAAELGVQGDATNDLSPTTIVAVSDFQQGARLDGLQAYSWPRQVRFRMQTVSDRAVDNAHWTLQPPSDNTTNRLPTLRLANEAGGNTTAFQVRWENHGAPIGPNFGLNVPAGQARTVGIPAGADTVTLTGDAVSFDNTAFIAPLKPRIATVAFFGNTNTADPALPYYFLERALAPTPRVEARLLPGAGLKGDDKAQLLVVASGLEAREAKSVGDRVRAGAHLLWLAPTPEALRGLEDTLQHPPTLIGAPASSGDTMLGRVDFEHPLFSMFRDARFNDFTKIHFWKRLGLTLPPEGNPHVLLGFDDGSPALTEWRVGRGRLWLLASDWTPAHSQLALSSKFVPLLYGMMEMALDADPDQAALPNQAVIGETIGAPAGADRVAGPGGIAIALDDNRRFKPVTPGVYEFIGASNKVMGACAVNIDPAESRLGVLATNTWSSLRVPTVESGGQIAQAELNRTRRESALAQERRQRWWQILLVVVLGLGVAESLWAGLRKAGTQEIALVTI